MIMEVNDPNYMRYHKRVYRARGKASAQRCISCNGTARHWASIHDTDGSNPYGHFQPMCVKCHNIYDLPIKGPRLTRAKIGKSMPRDGVERGAEKRRGTKRSPEAIEKTRQKLIGFKHTEQTRANMTAGQLKRAPLPPEVRAKVTEANRGQKRTEETRARMSAARKEWWRRKREGKEVHDG